MVCFIICFDIVFDIGFDTVFDIVFDTVFDTEKSRTFTRGWRNKTVNIKHYYFPISQGSAHDATLAEPSPSRATLLQALIAYRFIVDLRPQQNAMLLATLKSPQIWSWLDCKAFVIRRLRAIALGTLTHLPTPTYFPSHRAIHICTYIHICIHTYIYMQVFSAAREFALPIFSLA